MAAFQPALHAIDAGWHKMGGDPRSDFLMCYSAAWVYTTMATKAVEYLLKEKQYQQACELLRKLLGKLILAEIRYSVMPRINAQDAKLLMHFCVV